MPAWKQQYSLLSTGQASISACVNPAGQTYTKGLVVVSVTVLDVVVLVLVVVSVLVVVVVVTVVWIKPLGQPRPLIRQQNS